MTTFAQQSSLPQMCPAISLTRPYGRIHPGDVITIQAILSPKPLGEVRYRWHVNSGKVIGDAKGNEVKIGTRKFGDCESDEVLVRVDILGLEKSCPSSSTDKYGVSTGICDLVDEYEATVFTDRDKAYLDNFAIQVLRNPRASGIVILEASSPASAKAARLRAKKLKQHILYRKYPMDRFIFWLQPSDRDRTIMRSSLGPMPRCNNCEAL
jgi:hypothetical protein